MRNVDLKAGLPPFLLEYKEMDELMDGEQPEFQTLVSEYERLLDNLFIDSADNDGLTRFEKIAGILPSSNDTLEIRRGRLFARWNDVTPYTIRTLMNKIVGIQGNSNVQISLSSTTDYQIDITTRMEKRGQVDDLMYLLKVMIPCNLKINSVNRIEGETPGTLRQAAGISNTNMLFLTNDLLGEYEANAPIHAVVGYGQTNMLFLTNDLNETLNINGNLYAGNGISGTEQVGLGTEEY